MKEDKQGYRIWEIQEGTAVPKEIKSGNWEEYHELDLADLDLDNKTYAIRIGKEGLR